MRCLLSSVVACVLLADVSGAFAQDTAAKDDNQTAPTSQPVAKKTPRLRAATRPTRIVVSPESAARLLHERAMLQARMRRGASKRDGGQACR